MVASCSLRDSASRAAWSAAVILTRSRCPASPARGARAARAPPPAPGLPPPPPPPPPPRRGAPVRPAGRGGGAPAGNPAPAGGRGRGELGPQPPPHRLQRPHAVGRAVLGGQE